MRFTKMHGAGNDYVYVDAFRETLPEDLAALARRIADRRFGVGGDGLILIRPSEIADARMQMFNADGSEAEMCGNGIRCVAKYVHDHDIAKKPSLAIETAAGVLNLDLDVGPSGRVQQVTVDMGLPRTEAADVPTTLKSAGSVIDHRIEIAGRDFHVTCVSMGNPHCVIFAEDGRSVLDDETIATFGPQIECDSRFPRRVNVEFVDVISRGEVRQRTWERGSGETFACGTGAAAVCVAGGLTGRTDSRVLIRLRGGDLVLRVDESSGRVFMTGGATEVFQGEYCQDGSATGGVDHG